MALALPRATAGGPSEQCTGCNAPLALHGSDWKDKYTITFFVLHCIAIPAPILGLILCRYYSRRRASHAFSPTKAVWEYATTCAVTLISFVFAITNVAITEANTIVTFSYMVYYVFNLFFSLSSQFLVSLVMSNFIKHHNITERNRHRLTTAVKVMASILILLVAVEIGLQIVNTVLNINHEDYDYPYQYYDRSSRDILSGYGFLFDMCFQTLSAAAVVLLAIVFVIGSEGYSRPKSYVLFTSIALALLGIHFALYVAMDAIYLTTHARYSRLEDAREQFLGVASSVADLLLAVVLLLFLAMAATGCQPSSRQGTSADQEPNQPETLQSRRDEGKGDYIYPA